MSYDEDGVVDEFKMSVDDDEPLDMPEGMTDDFDMEDGDEDPDKDH